MDTILKIKLNLNFVILFLLHLFAFDYNKIAHESITTRKCIHGDCFQDLFFKSTLDSVFKVILGVELDTLRGTYEEGTKFSNAFNDASEITVLRYVDIFWKIKRFMHVGLEASLNKNIKVVDEFVYKIIKSKIEQVQKSPDESARKDILSRFLDLEDTDPTYLKDIILSFIIAGKDTTATTMSFFLYTLCKNPHMQDKIVEEVKEATKLTNFSTVEELADNITEEALENMQYLHAALTETLRLYPAVPWVIQHRHMDIHRFFFNTVLDLYSLLFVWFWLW